MIWERAQIEIKPGRERDFEAAVQQAVPLFSEFPRCRAMQLHRSFEHPQRYWLLVEWESVEDHTQHFRQSENFQKWRSLVGDHFASTPVVEHTQCVLAGF